jgi:phosphate transport system substrate-binding protein
MISWTLIPDSGANAQETLKYSCAAQIYDAFGQERLDAFTKETGIKVEAYVSSSGSAVYRLMNGFSDLASTTRPLYYRHKESGYVEIPFCRDPIAIIAHVSCTVRDITAAQVQGIFSGEIKNWKELGGPDQPVTVIVPGKETGAYKNFDRLAMERKEILYDFMSYQSTMVIEAVKRFPWSVSFISLGATNTKAATKTLTINGLDPKDKDYPYYQIFYFVVKGEPGGLEKKFIDFALSDKGKEIIKQKGMVPVSK